MANDGEEIRYRGVRKRKWGKYVAEIRSGRRSRISLGSYFTPYAAARAYDTALLCLRGPNATSFNFPESQLNSNAMEVAAAHTNPSPHAIRTAAIAVGSVFDTIPPPPVDDEEAGPSTGAGAIVKEATLAEASIQSREAHRVAEEEEEASTNYLLQAAIAVGSAFDTIPPPPPHDQEAGPSAGVGTSVAEVAPAEASIQSREEEEENDTKYLLQSPEYTSLEESIEMRPLQPELQVVPQPYDQSEVFPDLATWDAASKPPP